MATINSTTFPRVALRRPPSVCPRRKAASSVAKPSRPAEYTDQLTSVITKGFIPNRGLELTKGDDGDKVGDKDCGV